MQRLDKNFMEYALGIKLIILHDTMLEVHKQMNSSIVLVKLSCFADIIILNR